MLSIDTVDASLPRGFESYINGKLERDSSGGRPHFIKVLAEHRNAKEEILTLLELAWIPPHKTLRSIARKYRTTYHTIYRLLQDLEPFKENLITYLKETPRRKQFLNKETETSDYPTVQDYINHSKRRQLKQWKRRISYAQRVWCALNYKDPARWNIDQIYTFLNTMPRGANRNAFIDAIRKVAPQCQKKGSSQYLETERADIRRHKKEIYFPEMQLILQALNKHGLAYHATILKLHVGSGAREGSTDTKSGLTGISWNRFKNKFTLVGLYEIKVKKGIWWRNCPVDLIFPELPRELHEIWIQRGKPVTEKVIIDGYPELLVIYKEIRRVLEIEYDGKLEPNVFKEIMTIRPHDADKIHCNLLFEAGASIEDIAGEYKGGQEGWGAMGRGWLDINTIWKYYLLYGARSQRFKIKKRLVQQNCVRASKGEPIEYSNFLSFKLQVANESVYVSPSESNHRTRGIYHMER